MITEPTATDPPDMGMSITEKRTLSFDTTPDLVPNADLYPITATTSLTVIGGDGTLLTPAAAPVVQGTDILQVIDGSVLTADTVYQVRVEFTAYPSGNMCTMDLELSAWP